MFKGPTRIARRRALHRGVVLLAGLCLAGTAWAATFQHTDSHTTAKSPAEVWRILTAYSDTCDKGCKYHRPSLHRIVKVNHAATENKWYTWSHIGSSLKDAKFFTEVTISRGADGHFKSENRQLDKRDGALIEALEKKTGLPHSPVFDSGGTTTRTRGEGKNTVITQTVTVHTGAIVGLWAGKIREEMRKNVDATFANIER